MGDLSAHFDSSEFRDPTCGECQINQDLVDKLERLRAFVGGPITVTSGYRCPVHNARVGGAEDSQHLLGNAADVWWPGMQLLQARGWALASGFTGIGVYRDHLHVDVRPGGLAEWGTLIPTA